MSCTSICHVFGGRLLKSFAEFALRHSTDTNCVPYIVCAPGDALRHPFITGAPFYPRYASMLAADFDQHSPEEEKDGGAVVVRSVEKTNTILER
jgi:hypothetical protein